MKKFLTIVSVSLLCSGVSYQAMAETQVEEVRENHYEAHLESSEDAFQALNVKLIEIGDVLKNESELEFTEFESIHEISYTLEAAVDRLRADKAVVDSKLDILDEAVQAIHFSSENQEEAKTREWFIKLTAAAKNVNDKDSEVVIEKRDFYEIIIKDHKISPAELIVPAGQKIKLIVHNQDPTPEEFESFDFNREKIIVGNSKATIFIGPLKPGKYHYFGEFNKDSANAYIIVK